HLFGERAFGVGRRVGLGDDVLPFFHRRQVHNLVRHLSVHDFAVRGFDETVLVDARIGGQRVDQTDVRTFWRFNRADTAIVRGVHVADFEAGALARQTARAKR